MLFQCGYATTQPTLMHVWLQEESWRRDGLSGPSNEIFSLEQAQKKNISGLLPPLWRRETRPEPSTKPQTPTLSVAPNPLTPSSSFTALNIIFSLVEWPQHRNGQGLDVSSNISLKRKVNI